MKIKIKSVILVLLLAAFFFFPPVPTTIKIGEKVTSAGSTEVEVQLSAVRPSGYVPVLIYITVDSGNSGTIQFSVGEAIVSSHNAWVAGSKIPVTIVNGVSNLR